jgi:hypothetical protein
MEDTYPSSFYHSKHKLLTFHLVSNLPSQFDDWFEGDTLN